MIVLAKSPSGRLRRDGILVGDLEITEAQEPVLLGDLLPPLDQDPGDAGLLARQWPGCGQLIVPVARFVNSRSDSHARLSLQLGGDKGHVVIAGGARSGKTTFLTTFALALAVTHRPHEVSFLAIVGGGEGLVKIQALPHTIAIIDPDDAEKAAQFASQLRIFFSARQRMMRTFSLDSVEEFRMRRNNAAVREDDGHADIFVLIDGWRESVKSPELLQVIAKIADRGLGYGFHLAVTADSAADIPVEILQRLRTRLELRLDDASRSLFDPEMAQAISFEKPGIGIDVYGKRFAVAIPQFVGGQPEARHARDLVKQVQGSYGAEWSDRRWPESTQFPSVGEPAENSNLMRPLAFADLMGIADPWSFDPHRDWNQLPPAERLRVPIGVGENGEPVIIDIKEAAMGGMGPHGLCIGATGSGKSEVLRTLVLALAVTHSSENLNFVLSDFKGGATFAAMAEMPHTAAVITNLADDLTMVDRMRDAIVGEMNRRQEMLRDGGNFKNIHDYEKARAAGAALTPMPNLLIVLDEFSEMLIAKPEFLDLFIQIGRIGRSLGVHLLLASQRLEEGKLHGLDTYLSYRLGLKTFSPAESRAVLGVPDAFTLPSVPGSGFLKTVGNPQGNPAGARFKAAYVSGPARPDSSSPTVLDVLVERMKGQGPSAHQVWLPPLGEPPTLAQLMPDAASIPTLNCVIGVVDEPLRQRRFRYVLDLSSAAGHASIVGGPRTGKSTMVRTILMGLALRHTPREVQFFALDFGGGTLSSLAELPHTSGIGGRLDPDVVRRVVSEASSILLKREDSFRRHGIDSIDTFRARRARGELPDEPFGDVFLVVDGWATLCADFPQLEQDVLEIAQRGLGFGVHVVITAARWPEIRPKLKDAINTKIELRLGEPMESVVDRKAALNVPAGAPGRGLTQDKLHFLTALPRIDGVNDAADLADGVAKAVHAIAEASHGAVAPKLRMLPLVVPYTEMPAPALRPGHVVPLGVDETKLEPVYLDFNADPHFLLFGEGESGKSSVLRTLIRGVTEAYTPSEARILAVDYRRSLLDAYPESHKLAYCPAPPAAQSTIAEMCQQLRQRLPGVDVTAEQLRERSWWNGPDVFVVIDDYDLVAASGSNPLSPLLDFLPMARDVGLHLVIARASGGASRAMFEPFIQRLRETRQPGLILSGERDEGQLLGQVRPSQQPPGRGTLVSRRHGTMLIQTAFVDPYS